MSPILDLLYRYHQFIRSHVDNGLSIQEIESVSTLQSIGDLPRALLRGPRLAHRVEISELSPHRLTCVRAPFVEIGTTVELIIDDVTERHSYRFKAVIDQVQEVAPDNCTLQMRFVGCPILLRYQPLFRDRHLPRLLIRS